MCQGMRPGSAPCEQYRNIDIPEQTPISDSRVKAVVIADPGSTIFFGPDDLKEVKVRSSCGVRAWWSRCNSRECREPRSKAAIEIGLPHRAKCGALVLPCAMLTRANTGYPRACVDAPGFDRVTFHKHLHSEMIAFFNRHLVEGEKP